jgi:uncharacterized protein YqfB (UPF0267 family)
MKIDYFLIKQIKSNIIYLVVIILSSFLSIFSILYFFQQHSLYQQKKINLNKEIFNLETKKNLILNAINLKNESLPLDELNKIMNTLIPNEEDYFSIIFALEKISQQTGFIITNYTVNIQKSTPKRLSLKISGIGQRDTFFNFIKNYQFGGNRLITLDDIRFSEETLNQTEINLNFYNDEAKTTENLTYRQLTEKDKQLLKEILKKTDINIYEATPIEGYEKKNNPF